jgi:hypothetical protein
MKQPDSKLKWIDSLGGPLLLIPGRLLNHWEGSDPPTGGRIIEAKFRADPSGPATDYDRACDVKEYLGLIDVGPGVGLVLGDEPAQTAWWPFASERGGILVRWIAADDEQSVIQHLKNLPLTRFPMPILSMMVPEGPLILFDSAFPGHRIDQGYSAQIKLPPQLYGVATWVYSEADKISLILHKLESKI